VLPETKIRSDLLWKFSGFTRASFVLDHPNSTGTLKKKMRNTLLPLKTLELFFFFLSSEDKGGALYIQS
jgi:hypothetical protein